MLFLCLAASLHFEIIQTTNHCSAFTRNWHWSYGEFIEEGRWRGWGGRQGIGC